MRELRELKNRLELKEFLLDRELQTANKKSEGTDWAGIFMIFSGVVFIAKLIELSAK